MTFMICPFFFAAGVLVRLKDPTGGNGPRNQAASDEIAGTISLVDSGWSRWLQFVLFMMPNDAGLHPGYRLCSRLNAPTRQLAQPGKASGSQRGTDVAGRFRGSDSEGSCEGVHDHKGHDFLVGANEGPSGWVPESRDGGFGEGNAVRRMSPSREGKGESCGWAVMRRTRKGCLVTWDRSPISRTGDPGNFEGS
jgi:hypothetical protein